MSKSQDLNHNITYSEYLAEKLDENIEYSYTGSIEKSIKYTEYLAEQIDKSISYTQYIKDNIPSRAEKIEYILND